MKKTLLLLASLLFACLLSAAAPAQAAESVSSDTLVLGDESAEEILALAAEPFLREVDGMECAEKAAMAELWRLRPELELRYVYDYRGQLLPGDTSSLVMVAAGKMPGVPSGYSPRISFCGSMGPRPLMAFAVSVYSANAAASSASYLPG